MRSANVAKRDTWTGTVEEVDGDVGAAGKHHRHYEEDQGHQEHHHQKCGLIFKCHMRSKTLPWQH